MFDGSDPCWVPDLPVTMDQEWRIREAAFGDGYAQRILDGINALNVKFNVSFDTRPADIIQAMLDYFVALQGAAFPFKDPATGVTYQVWCDSWRVDWSLKHGNPKIYYGTLSAEFRKANGVAL